MDLYAIETYFRPTQWHPEHWLNAPSLEAAWLAGGTWLFSEPQPHLKTLIDLEALNWSDIVLESDHLSIGATCRLGTLMNYGWPPEWIALTAVREAIQCLAASFKVVQVATVGGNLCLALAIGVLAPLMVLLDATYELWDCNGVQRYVPAGEFQRGIRQTVLRSREVLRRIWIPQRFLHWPTQVQRIGISATDPALSLVMMAKDPTSDAVRISLGASVPSPQLLCFEHPPSFSEFAAVGRSLPWLEDFRASANYRQAITSVLVQRMVQSGRS